MEKCQSSMSVCWLHFKDGSLSYPEDLPSSKPTLEKEQVFLNLCRKANEEDLANSLVGQRSIRNGISVIEVS